MYAALDRLPDTAALRHEFFNARGAILRFGRRAMEVRVLDTQECVKMDVALAVFVRAALRHLAGLVRAGGVSLPPHEVLAADFRAAIRDGSRARVHAPHLEVDRDADGTAAARDILAALLAARAAPSATTRRRTWTLRPTWWRTAASRSGSAPRWSRTPPSATRRSTPRRDASIASSPTAWRRTAPGPGVQPRRPHRRFR
jgi:hypothetical protein